MERGERRLEVEGEPNCFYKRVGRTRLKEWLVGFFCFVFVCLIFYFTSDYNYHIHIIHYFSFSHFPVRDVDLSNIYYLQLRSIKISNMKRYKICGYCHIY